jgi:hypothetical protein
MVVGNTLAYYNPATIMVVKSYIVHTMGKNRKTLRGKDKRSGLVENSWDH